METQEEKVFTTIMNFKPRDEVYHWRYKDSPLMVVGPTAAQGLIVVKLAGLHTMKLPISELSFTPYERVGFSQERPVDNRPLESGMVFKYVGDDGMRYGLWYGPGNVYRLYDKSFDFCNSFNDGATVADAAKEYYKLQEGLEWDFEVGLKPKNKSC